MQRYKAIIVSDIHLGTDNSKAAEFLEFLKVRKKYWLLPILIILVLFAGLIVLTQGSAVAPFIYTIF